MLAAPESVNVKQRMLDGSVSVFLRIWAARMLSNSVLPVPGPAITNNGPSMLLTAAC